MSNQFFITPQQSPQIEYENGVFRRTMAATSTLQLREVFIERGNVASAHHHDTDQVSYVVYGEVEMTIDDETQICRAGDSFAVATGVVHGAKALTDTLIIVVVSASD